jgi:hypothetical protein
VAITVEALVNGQSQLQYLNPLVFYSSAAVLLVLTCCATAQLAGIRAMQAITRHWRSRLKHHQMLLRSTQALA